MNDTQKVLLLESALREILSIDLEAAQENRPGSIPFYLALEGGLRYRWLDIRAKVEGLLKGEAR